MWLVSRPVDALRQIDSWPSATAAVALVSAGGAVAAHGPQAQAFRWTSVTKLATALATLVAVEEGSVDLDQPAGPAGATLRHLLAHTAGYSFDEATVLAPPGTRRIYSNVGIEAAAAVVEEAAGMPFADYLRAAVLDPLGLRAELRGSPAHGLSGPVSDLALLGRELLVPTLVARETLDEATVVAFPGLSGVLPLFGRQEPCDWGLGFELRAGKSPHWTGTRNSPRTFGHFGGSGSFLWVDPEAGVALACLTDLDAGPWIREAWPALADAVLAEL
jgi:CubicO group peptidase (beta-lactamase class C family)